MGNNITHKDVGASLTKPEFDATDSHEGGTGRGATIVVSLTGASSDSTAQADSTVGADGSVAIIAALAALP